MACTDTLKYIYLGMEGGSVVWKKKKWKFADKETYVWDSALPFIGFSIFVQLNETLYIRLLIFKYWSHRIICESNGIIPAKGWL